jgi:Calcium binding
MRKPRKDPIREDRIQNEAIVDAYGAEERAMGWYYYLENQLQIPFRARCIAANIVSPLSKGETVEVLRMAPEESCWPTCSCSSAGRAGNWRYLYPNWPRSTSINLLPMPSAIGIIG